MCAFIHGISFSVAYQHQHSPVTVGVFHRSMTAKLKLDIDTGNVSWADWAAVFMLVAQYVVSAMQGTWTHRSYLRKWQILGSFRVPIHVMHIFTLIILLEDYGFATAVLYLGGNAVIELVAIYSTPPKHSLKGLFRSVSKSSQVLFAASVAWSLLICVTIILAIALTNPHQTPIGTCTVHIPPTALLLSLIHTLTNGGILFKGSLRKLWSTILKLPMRPRVLGFPAWY